MGPFAQLDSVVVNSDPPVPSEQRGLPVMWHRDRFGFVPPGAYVRPASVVFLAYLQPMTDDAGPLRVIPGSHRDPRLLTPDDLYAPLPDEQLIHTEPGDAVAIHHNLLHAGTRNTSQADRRFLGFILNLSVLRAEDNFAGPNCRALASSARRDKDRRLLRLLGEDPLIFPRQNSGFTRGDEADWQRWRDEDAEHAGEAAVTAATASTVRSELALPA
jgi:ectoine hydroxylase-related dioxygenase (phytanoyl-CoA dioxygenase family)